MLGSKVIFQHAPDTREIFELSFNNELTDFITHTMTPTE